MAALGSAMTLPRLALILVTGCFLPPRRTTSGALRGAVHWAGRWSERSNALLAATSTVRPSNAVLGRDHEANDTGRGGVRQLPANDPDVFPDQEVCNRQLAERLQSVPNPDLIVRRWVTKPFLAWGGVLEVGAVVGPIEHLYSITEAHVTYRDARDREVKAHVFMLRPVRTFRRSTYLACGGSQVRRWCPRWAQDSRRRPSAIVWRCPPGNATEWEPGIRYYRK